MPRAEWPPSSLNRVPEDIHTLARQRRSSPARFGRRGVVLKLILVPALVLALASVSLPTAPAAVPVCSAWPYEADCGPDLGGVALFLSPHCDDTPECSPSSWVVAAVSCSATPGALVVAWTFFLSDVPAFADAALTQPTGDADCPHRASVHRLHNGGTFQMPIECVHATATSPGGAAERLLCAHS